MSAFGAESAVTGRVMGVKEFVLRQADERMMREQESSHVQQPPVQPYIPRPISALGEGGPKYTDAFQEAIAQSRVYPNPQLVDGAPFGHAFHPKWAALPYTTGVDDRAVVRIPLMYPDQIGTVLQEISVSEWSRVTVNQCRSQIPGLEPNFFAVKTDVSGSESKLKDEAALMRYAQHRNVMPLRGLIQSPHGDSIVMPLARRGTVADYISREFKAVEQNNPRLSASSKRFPGIHLIAKSMHDAMRGCEALHNLGYRHNNITLRNLLVSSDGTTVLSDFGRATYYNVSEYDKARELLVVAFHYNELAKKMLDLCIEHKLGELVCRAAQTLYSITCYDTPKYRNLLDKNPDRLLGVFLGDIQQFLRTYHRIEIDYNDYRDPVDWTTDTELYHVLI